MVEARRIPPTDIQHAPIARGDEGSGAVPPDHAEPWRDRRPAVVGAIAPGVAAASATPQVRAAAAWRAWLRGEGARHDHAPHDATNHDVVAAPAPAPEPAPATTPPSTIAVPRSHAANAEMLVWQNQLRLAFVGTASVAALILRLIGVLHASSIAAHVLGAQQAAEAHVLFVAAYCLLVLATQRRLARRSAARLAAVTALALGDQALVFATTFLLAPPQYYARALLLAFFSLQITQTFFGRRVAMIALATTVVGYATLCASALHLGGALDVAEETWTVALFLGGAGAAIAVQGTLAGRLNHLVRLFERTEEGDFTQAYDEAADPRPDVITRVGRAYNRMRLQLSAIVLTDPLSGCLNRRGFDQALEREVSRSARAGGELSLIAIDIDYFKRINDTFGHLAGDAVIREAGALLREATRTGDVVARVGGEEFMVLAPDTGAAGAFNVASRIVDAFRKRAFEGVAGRIPVTVSAGVVADAVRTPHVAEDLKARADEALYSAKRGGRNRVAMWSGKGGV